MNIYEKLTNKYDSWNVSSPKVVSHEAEGRMSLFIELECDAIKTIGCSSCNVDFSVDVTEKLLEKAVVSAYKKIRIMERGF